MTTQTTIGKVFPNGAIEKEWSGQGHIYKNFGAFINKTDEICYINELDEANNVNDENFNGYTYEDFLDLAKGTFDNNGYKGNPEVLAMLLFEFCDWQSPETLIDEWETDGEFENYPEQHGIIN